MVEPVGDILIRAASAGSLHARRNLQSVGFVRRSFEDPAQAICEGQTRGHPPGILSIEFVVVKRITALDCGALRQRTAVPGKVIFAVTFGENPQKNRGRTVIVRTEAGIDRGIAVVARVEGAGSVGNSAGVEIDRVSRNVGVGVRETVPIVSNQQEIAAKLNGMIGQSPVQVVAEFVGRNKGDGGASERNKVGKTIQINARILRVTSALHSLADIAPVKIIDEFWRKKRSESDG